MLWAKWYVDKISSYRTYFIFDRCYIYTHTHIHMCGLPEDRTDGYIVKYTATLRCVIPVVCVTRCEGGGSSNNTAN